MPPTGPGQTFAVGLPDSRFGAPGDPPNYVSEYDLDPNEIQDALRRGRGAIERITIDLSTRGDNASSANVGYRRIQAPGRAFVAFGFTTGDVKRANKNDFMVMVAIDDPSPPPISNGASTVGDSRYPANAFPAKHGRGYNGSFRELHVYWDPTVASYATTSIDLIVYRSNRDPWMMDQST